MKDKLKSILTDIVILIILALPLVVGIIVVYITKYYEYTIVFIFLEVVWVMAIFTEATKHYRL